MSKRTTWRDRKCANGKPAYFRAQYDIVSCEEKGCGCFEVGLNSVGLMSMPKPEPIPAAPQEDEKPKLCGAFIEWETERMSGSLIKRTCERPEPCPVPGHRKGER